MVGLVKFDFYAIRGICICRKITLDMANNFFSFFFFISKLNRNNGLL